MDLSAGGRGCLGRLFALLLASGLGVAVAALASGCGPPPPSEPLAPGTFSFGVFGDGPYYLWENARFSRLLEDVSASDVKWLIHVGDILEAPCTDSAYRERREQLNEVAHPVIYIPGDNEWTDCHGSRQGRYDPLDRLASLRRVFFSAPGRSLGASPMKVASQASDSAFAEFPENVRWRHGGVVFATLHFVGSQNGMEPFSARTPAHDRAVERRTAAALDWMDRAFAVARADSAWGVALAFHADMGLLPEESIGGFERILERLRENISSFPGKVLLIHGDSHMFTLDHPLRDAGGQTFPNVTRLETFGSPEIGWIRVVVDTVRTEFAAFEPRVMKGWF